MTNQKTDTPQFEELNDADLEKASGGATYYEYQLKNLKHDEQRGWKVGGAATRTGGNAETTWKVEKGEK